MPYIGLVSQKLSLTSSTECGLWSTTSTQDESTVLHIKPRRSPCKELKLHTPSELGDWSRIISY